MSKKVTDKYEIIKPVGLYQVPHFGEVDLGSLTLKKADLLYAQKFPLLKLIPKVKATAKDSKPKKEL